MLEITDLDDSCFMRGKLCSMGGDNLALGPLSLNLYCIGATESSVIRHWSGFLGSQGGFSKFENTACIHHNLHGSLFRATSDVMKVTSIEASQPATYRGPTIKLDELTLTYNNGRTQTFTGLIILDFSEFSYRTPDHLYDHSGAPTWRARYKYEYRKCLIEGRRTGDETYTVTTSWTLRYWFQGNWSEWKTNTHVNVINITKMRMLSLNSQNQLAVPKKKMDELTIRFPFYKWKRILTNLRMRYPKREDDMIFGNLSAKMAEDAVCLGRNNVSFLAEIPALASSIGNMAKLACGPATLKAAASLYLSWTYGPQLTVKDAVDNFGELSSQITYTKKDHKWVRAMEVVKLQPLIQDVGDLVVQYHSKVYYQPLDMGPGRLAYEAWNYGLFPTLQNAWDMVPFSFVVDWFADVEGQLQAYDATTFWSMCDILECVYSTKETYHGVLGLLKSYLGNPESLCGDVSITSYRRMIARQPHQPLYISPETRQFRNYLEGASLLIANTKKR